MEKKEGTNLEWKSRAEKMRRIKIYAFLEFWTFSLEKILFDAQKMNFKPNVSENIFKLV